MELIRAHTSAKDTDFAKLLLLNKRRLTPPPKRSIAVSPTNCNRNPTLTLT